MPMVADRRFFDSYVESITALQKSEAAYLDAHRAASDFLRKVRKRQDSESYRIAEMVEKLDAEEREMRVQIRKQAVERGESLLHGKAVSKSDGAAAARLAAIPEEKAALLELQGKHRLTRSEREQWESLVSALYDTGTALEEAIRARERETNRLRKYAREIEFWATGITNVNYDTLLNEVYELNKDYNVEEESAND